MYSLEELPCWKALMAVPRAQTPLSSGTWETVFMGKCSCSSSCSTFKHLADLLLACCHGLVYGMSLSADLSSACRVRDWLGFSIGMTSIMFWMVAQVPQFVKNIRQQRADALSAWFLAEWLLVRSVCTFTV